MESLKWLFVSDVDDTLLGDDEALGRLSKELDKARQQVTIVYNSSRPCASLRESLSAVSGLLMPDYLIGGMGTEIERGEGGERLTEYEGYLQSGWNREQIVDLVSGLDAEAHPDKYQTAFKVSFSIPGSKVYDVIKERLSQTDIEAKAIFSAGKFIDLIAAKAGKGEAIRYLQKQLNIPAEQVVVAGDSGNDVEMFVAPFKGIIVGNADQDLKRLKGDHIYHAKRPYAAGLLEGLRYWGVLKGS